MKNPPIALTRAIRKALYGQAHTSHDARHPGQSPDPYTYAPTLPAADSHGGINKIDYDRGSVLVSIPVYGSMARDDTVTLYWNNEYVDYGVIVDETVSFPMTVDNFYIPLDATSAVVHYHTLDMGGNERVSYSTNVVIKLTVPGNPPEPPDPADPSLNPNLQPPYNIPSFIPNAASAGDLEVFVHQYANMEEGDVVSLFWAGEVIQYGPLVTADLNRDVRIVVPNATLVARPGMDLVVRYSIRDRLQNYSRYSPSVLTTVYAPGSLPEPTVEGTASGDLHIDQITDGLVEVHVNRHQDIGQADNVTLHWTGRPVAGAFQNFTVGPLQIGTDRYLVFQIPVDIAQVLIDSQAYVYYAVAPAGGGATKLSAGATFGVIGTRNELKAPQVPRASGGALNPENISEATIEVVVPANVLLAPGTTVTLTWTGVGVDGTVYHTDSRSIDSGSAGGPVSFQVPKEKATKLIGSTLDLYYTLTLADGTGLPAPHLSLNVIGSSAALPPPEFDPELAAGDVLDPDSLTTGGINVIVKVLSSQYVPGKAVLHWVGSGASITPPLELPVTTTGERRFWVDKTRFVDPNLDDTVQVWYDLVKDTGERASSQTVLVNVSNAGSQPWLAPEVHDASGGPVNPWIPVRPGSPGANSANFVLRDARLKVNDVVAPFWLLPGGQDLDISWITVTVDGEAQAAIPATVLAASVGKTVQVSYSVLRNNVPGPVSAVLNLQVAALPATGLVAPTVDEVPSGNLGTLDLNTFPGDAHVSAVPWPLIGEGQTYWLRAHGIADDGTNISHDLAMGVPVTAGQVTAGLKVTLPRSYLLRLQNTSTLFLELKVSLGKSSSEAEATTFPVGEVIMRQLTLDLLAPTVAGEVNGYLDPATIPAGGVVVTVPSYTGIAVGQWVGLEWTAVDPANSVEFPAQKLDSLTPPVFTVSKAQAEKSTGKAVAVVYKVARVQGAFEESSEPVPFVVGKEGAGTSPQIEDFESYPIGTVTMPFHAKSATVSFSDVTTTSIKQINGNKLLEIRSSNAGTCTVTPLMLASRLTLDVDNGSTGGTGGQCKAVYERGTVALGTASGSMWINISTHATFGKIKEVTIYFPYNFSITYLDNISVSF